jgi:hypothetical protein
MDIRIKEMVKEAQERGWDVSFSTIYRVEERSVSGESWYSLGEFSSLGDATDCRMRHFMKWYSRVFDCVDDVESLRIVMRHTVEVVL